MHLREAFQSIAKETKVGGLLWGFLFCFFFVFCDFFSVACFINQEKLCNFNVTSMKFSLYSIFQSFCLHKLFTQNPFIKTIYKLFLNLNSLHVRLSILIRINTTSKVHN